MKQARLWRLLALVPGFLLALGLAFFVGVWSVDAARELWPTYAPEVHLLGWDGQGRLVFSHEEYYARSYDSGSSPCGNSGLYAAAEPNAVPLEHGPSWCARFPTGFSGRLAWASRVAANDSAHTLSATSALSRFRRMG